MINVASGCLAWLSLARDPLSVLPLAVPHTACGRVGLSGNGLPCHFPCAVGRKLQLSARPASAAIPSCPGHTVVFSSNEIVSANLGVAVSLPHSAPH